MLRRVFALICVGLALSAAARENTGLPAEAYETLRLVDAGGPFLSRRDGITFQNRERRLPEREHGYYREYTVPTPGSRDRGARRIITGGHPPVEYYYTADHYRSFRRIPR
jgi:guanyl-specific ribonuclease Sa